VNHPLSPGFMRRIPVALFLLLPSAVIGSAPGPSQGQVDVNPTFTISKYAPGSPIHMVGYGDMRFTDPSVTTGTNPRVRKWLAERVAQENPEVLMLTYSKMRLHSGEPTRYFFSLLLAITR
jgi:hypothetical protein